MAPDDDDTLVDIVEGRGDGYTALFEPGHNLGIVDERAERVGAASIADGGVGHVESALDAVACPRMTSFYNLHAARSPPFDSCCALRSISDTSSCVVWRTTGCSANTAA